MTAAEAATLPHMGDYDVIIIGAMIARQLSKLKGRFAVLEKEAFPGFGVSKASLSQIHLPDFCPPGSLKGRLCRNAPARFKKLAAHDIWDFQRIPQPGYCPDGARQSDSWGALPILSISSWIPWFWRSIKTGH